MPRITLNGKPHPLESTTTVAVLLAGLGMEGKPVVVELNGDALLPGDHATTTVRDGAAVEIIALAAGG